MESEKQLRKKDKMKYHKIHSLFKRDHQTNKFTHEWSRPEFEWLRNNQWRFDEKVDGTNVRVMFSKDEDGFSLEFRGRTDNAQMPPKLLDHLHGRFNTEKLKEIFYDNADKVNITLFGEGYGAKIQKGGGDYRPDQGFILFDININGCWLRRDSVEDIADKLGIPVTPIIGYGDILDAINLCKEGFPSKLRDSEPEGIILRPLHEICDRRRDRIISKLKLKDFR